MSYGQQGWGASPPAAVNCAKGHPLVWMTPNYNGQRWSCDKCGHGSDAGTCSWHCHQCKFDLCTKCHSAQAGHAGHGQPPAAYSPQQQQQQQQQPAYGYSQQQPPPQQGGYGAPPQWAGAGGGSYAQQAPQGQWGGAPGYAQQAPPSGGYPQQGPLQGQWGGAPGYGQQPPPGAYPQQPQGQWGGAPPAQQWGGAPPPAQGGYGAPVQGAYGAPLPPGAQGGYAAPPVGGAKYNGGAETAAGQASTSSPTAPQQYGGYQGASPVLSSYPTIDPALSALGNQPQHPTAAYGMQTAYKPTGTLQPISPSATRRALLVGINYTKRGRNVLQGCVNDVKHMAEFLRPVGFYDMTILTDENPDEHAPTYPSKRNILAAIDRFVSGIKAGDSLFFHYSGHGSQLNGGKDDCICPLDFDSAGIIQDDDLFARMADKIPPGARLTAIMDCCHSGTGMDLMYNFKDEYHKLETKRAITARSLGTTEPTKGDVVLFSGCKDDQTSADTNAFGVASGAMSTVWLQIVRDRPQQTYADIVFHVRDKMREKKTLSQVPQLSFGRDVDPYINYFAI